MVSLIIRCVTVFLCEPGVTAVDAGRGCGTSVNHAETRAFVSARRVPGVWEEVAGRGTGSGASRRRAVILGGTGGAGAGASAR
jgi:hypothetical protein